ncbi:MAG: phosphoribosyltransferase, partial [Candidatus Kapaibacterium sp.]
MKTVTLHDLSFRLRFSEEEIRRRVQEVAAAIRGDYETSRHVFVVILNGGMFFAVDLLRSVGVPCTVATLRTSSYGAGTTSSGVVEFIGAIPDVGGRDVIIVEDIVDTGTTVHLVREALLRQQPRSIAVAAVVDKPGSHAHDVTVDYRCFRAESEFLVGYGLDYAGLGRELTDIFERIPEKTADQP